ncbi:MAG TPA: efflux RND transporter periplasmic adaptor subunit [Acetobacteraceae bacterium]|jgi:membrane fusion protein, heavy metal efflux system|nr:efflux RND transporter periplasmic adaptor subunit [Acetobacteraceae bacterium]
MDQPNPSHDAERAAPTLGPRLSRRVQLTVLGLAVALILAGFFVGPALVHLAGLGTHPASSEEEPSAVEGETFRATEKQWQLLNIQPVRELAFQDSFETDGRIALDDDLVTPVFSPFSGHVTKLLVRAGDVVHRGDPLFTIQATELAQAQNDVISAVAALKTAKAQLSLATTNEKRQHDLYSAQGAALKDWQQAQVDLATAQGGMNSASIALAAVRSRLRILGKTDRDIEQIEATPDVLHLDADSVVSAPIGGTVVQRQIGLGQNIVSAASGASSPVFMIGDLSKVWLVANAREDSAPFLQRGDTVQATVVALPGQTFTARLTYVAASIDPNTHRLPVHTELDNSDGALKPEMLASFRILSGSVSSAPAIPESALVYEGESAHVWVANAQTHALEIRQVKLGRMHNGMVEATDGVRAGEEIVTAGALFIDRAVTGD